MPQIWRAVLVKEHAAFIKEHAAGKIASEVGRQIIRGVLGSILGGGRAK